MQDYINQLNFSIDFGTLVYLFKYDYICRKIIYKHLNNKGIISLSDCHW